MSSERNCLLIEQRQPGIGTLNDISLFGSCKFPHNWTICLWIDPPISGKCWKWSQEKQSKEQLQILSGGANLIAAETGAKVTDEEWRVPDDPVVARPQSKEMC